MRRAGLTPDEISERLRAARVRPTAQRVAVCRFVLCEADHPTAEDVRAWTREKGFRMSLATVYNTLGALVRAGLLRELRMPHTERLVYDDNMGPHHHFLDDKTGRIEDLPLEAVEVRPRLGGAFRVREVSVVVRGEKA